MVSSLAAALRTWFGVAAVLSGCAHSALGAPEQKAPPVPPAQTAEAEVGTALEYGSIFVRCGFLYFENRGEVPFTVMLKASDPRVVPGQNVVILDGVPVEPVSVTAAEIGAPAARGAELLLAHREWELAYTEKLHGWAELQTSGGAVDLGLDRVSVMMWGYDFPTPIEVLGQRVDRVAYLTAAVENVVFVLATPLRPGDGTQVPAQKVGQIMRSLRRRDAKLEQSAVSKQVSAPGGVWPDCE